MALLFSGCTILPMTAQGQEAKTFVGWVGVVGNRIALVTEEVEQMEQFVMAHQDVRHIDGVGKLLMPGLINTHCHAAMTLQRSSADDIPLMSWLNDHIWPFEQVQTTEDILLGAELGVVEMLLGGVTSFVDMYFDQELIYDVVDRLGIRAMLGCNCFDSTIDAAEKSVVAGVEKSRGGSRIRMAVAPHSAYTCSPETLKRIKALGDKHGLHLMIHIAETKDESRIIMEKYGKSPVQYLDDLGLLDDKTIGAHCIYVDDRDIEILKARGVAISHNPHSNMKISSGVAPIEDMRAKGLICTIGTDGACSNNDLDMWEELRSAAFLQKSATGDPCVMPAYDVLKMVTVQGAKAIGHGGELGVIAPGALADLILVDLNKPHMRPIHDLVSNMVYSGKASDVEMVVVDGRIVVEDRKVIGVDLRKLLNDVDGAVANIITRKN